jgi:hypothetical protein
MSWLIRYRLRPRPAAFNRLAAQARSVFVFLLTLLDQIGKGPQVYKAIVELEQQYGSLRLAARAKRVFVC